MLLRSSILAGVATIALVGFAQAASQTAPAPADMPSTQTAPAAPMAAPAPGVPLKDVQSPKTTLRGAAVVDAKGEAIGEVKSVEVGTDGKVAAVHVSVGSKTVALKADTLTFAQADKTLISTQTKAEIEAK